MKGNGWAKTICISASALIFLTLVSAPLTTCALASVATSAKDAKALVSLAKAMINTYGVPEADIGGGRIPEEGWDLMPQVLTELETEVADSDLIITLTMTFDEIERMLEGPETD